MESKTTVTQLYRLNVEPRVIDQLSKLAAKTGEPKTRLARRLFTDAVMALQTDEERVQDLALARQAD